MRSSLSRFPILLLLALIGLIFSSCDVYQAGASSTGDPNSDPPPTPVQVSPDRTTPSTLNVSMRIDDDQDASDGKVNIIVLFSTDEINNPNFIHFSHGEKIYCNNVQMAFHDTAYSARVTVANGAFTCTYVTSNGLYYAFTVYARTYLDPHFVPNALNTTFRVNYNADSTSATCPLEADVGDSSHPLAKVATSDSFRGAISANISSLSGLGILVLTRTCTLHPPSAFNAITTMYVSTARIYVTWYPPL